MPEMIRLYTQRKRAKDAAIALARLKVNGQADIDVKVYVASDGEYYLEVDCPLDIEDKVSGILALGEDTSRVYDASDCVEFYQGPGLTRFRQV